MRWKKFLLILLILGFAFIVARVVGDISSEAYIFNFQIFFSDFDGNTTNFLLYNETQLRNLPKVILEVNAYGNITFLENLDLVTMAGRDGIVDFDTDIIIGSNVIFVNTANLPGINKDVYLSLYRLNYTDPVIYQNGVVCTTCVLINYSGGNITFLAPSFSGMYYIRERTVPPFCGDNICNNRETCRSCPNDCGNCPPELPPGEGEIPPGTVPPVIDPTQRGMYDFKMDPWFFSVRMNKGTYYRQIIRVTNNGTADIPLLVRVDPALTRFIFPEVRGFVLPVGQTRELKLDIYVSKQDFADVHFGKISLVHGELIRSTEVVLDVRERDALFDIRTEVLKKYINPGGRVRANVSIINFGDIVNFDVSLEYKIIDFNRVEYTIKKEDFAINRTYSNIFYLDVPEDIPIGNYLFFTRVSYKNVNASSYDTFTVENISSFAWTILLLILLILMYLIYKWYKYKKEELIYKSEERRRKKEEEDKIIEKLPKRDGVTKKIEVPELP